MQDDALTLHLMHERVAESCRTFYSCPAMRNRPIAADDVPTPCRVSEVVPHDAAHGQLHSPFFSSQSCSIILFAPINIDHSYALMNKNRLCRLPRKFCFLQVRGNSVLFYRLLGTHYENNTTPSIFIIHFTSLDPLLGKIRY